MEIISFVQGDSRPKRNLLSVMPKKSGRSSYGAASLTYSDFSYGAKSFTVQRVKHVFSVKAILSAVGKFAAGTVSFFKNNILKLVLAVVILCAAAAVTVTGIYFYEKLLNHTGALTLQADETVDIEKLNKLMEHFALEGTVDYDESGNLLDENLSVAAASYSQPVTYQNYKVRSGDTISGIAKKFGLKNISTLISVNDIGNVRQLAAGQKLKIPSIDGIVYTVKNGDTINSIVAAKKISLKELLDVNDLSSEVLTAGQVLFIPGAALDAKTLKQAMGEQFILPIQGKFRWTSPYGTRTDPISGVKKFHTGVDMACPTGTPIVAAQSGTVVKVSANPIYGNYIIIDHGNGYQTLYYHMSKTIAKKDQWVSQGTRIGLVGSTGYSTGPHLHFTVYKNGQMINPMTILK